MKVYENLRDKEIIRKVNEVFYEKVYEHPWLSLYFKDVTQEFITSQQTDFITGAAGGPSKFSGRMPSNAHPHMFITEELYDLRTQLLKEAMQEVNAPIELQDFWLKLDESFKNKIVKNSLSECEKRFTTDELLIFENPDTHKKAA